MTHRSAWRRAGRFGALLAGLALVGGVAQAACEPSIRSVARCEWIVSAEARLARGDATEALQMFERAAASEHAVDIELGIVRSQLQAGDFRRAMAFAAHTAGAHGSDAGGAALYVWLLALSGQSAFGQRLLDQSRARLPDDPLLAELSAQLASAAPAPSAAMRNAPARLAPFGVGDAPPASARLASSGLLLAEGRHALVPAIDVRAAGRIWVRDGLGRTVEAHKERDLEAPGVAMLRLDLPLIGIEGDGPTGVDADAFPGSPACAVAYGGAAEATPAWPWLRSGFLGSAGADGRERRLGIELPAHALPGGPVFDLSGRLLGLVLGGHHAAGQMLLPVSLLRAELGAQLLPTSGASAQQRLPADELYERAMRVALQVIVAP